MTRETAICGLEDMLMSKIDGRNNLEVYGEEIPIMLVQDIEALKLAIEALQERPKGRCRFCKDMDIINELVCYLPKENGSAVDVPINFCPKCGADMRESEQE